MRTIIIAICMALAGCLIQDSELPKADSSALRELPEVEVAPEYLCGLCYYQDEEIQTGPVSFELIPGPLVWEPCADQDDPETCGGFGPLVCDGSRERFRELIMTQDECFDR